MLELKHLEEELEGYLKQREQAIANVHALDGAVQVVRHLIERVKAEAEKLEAELKKVV